VLIAHSWLVYLRLPDRWVKAKFSGKNLANLLSFGAWMTLSNIISPLMVMADRFVISAILGASVVAYYTVPFEVLIRVLIIPGALTSALFPRFAMMLRVDVAGARVLYMNSIKMLLAVLIPFCVAIGLCSKSGLSLWLGDAFADQSWLIVSILAVGLLFNGLAHVPFAAVQASGNARATALLHIAEVIIYIPTLLILIKMFGLVGAAMAWTARALIDLIALLLTARVQMKESS
jgi:O-antigen/teichoic acid export membrane protein